ncbi:uncharacterized protein BCR38DRAFT_525794 [Pseudomassariella vexata]|uniref:Nuclear membrane fusion protein Kar5 n=1 Tax=Pseudomassariella vexata TaxID=1141098 RepID=A0A1Y2DRS3_9PEZI|nr:uncharacterized protein BCR38DRAFT_525794 [Pseudomassariella vexata]ORY61385.1 hypothetical protein BCR38DRAFT_525794 [Pseudomassariella vexata]
MIITQSNKMIWIRLVALFVLAHSEVVCGFSWRRDSGLRAAGKGDRTGLDPSLSASHLLQTVTRLPSTYEIALNELQELESEPLCHRTAATLLVNNCQLLEGKDEATILTDSGRQIRDFVDAYAASLAICDLERGSFVIPRECGKFQESIITHLALQNTAQLHVTSKEIDGCLSGLAQNILLFQRLTKIMSNLADGMDERVERRMTDLDKRAQMMSDRLDRLSPQLDGLKTGITTAEDLISGSLAQALRRSTDTVNSGIVNAASLQRMLEVMMSSILATNAEAAEFHEQSLEMVSRKAESEMSSVMTAMAAAVTSASILQNQIDLFRLQAAELEYRQGNLEQGMQRLVHISENLSDKYDDHTNFLQQAQNMTEKILYSLGETVTSAATMGDAFSRQSSAKSWWPYIWCPAASLVMGSYGLPPSAVRNLALVALGEAAGFVVSFVPSISLEISSFSLWGVLSSFASPSIYTSATKMDGHANQEGM